MKENTIKICMQSGVLPWSQDLFVSLFLIRCILCAIVVSHCVWLNVWGTSVWHDCVVTSGSPPAVDQHLVKLICSWQEAKNSSTSNCMLWLWGGCGDKQPKVLSQPLQQFSLWSANESPALRNLCS